MQPADSSDQLERADRRTWTGLAALALVPILLSLDLTVLFLALPSLSEDLHPSSIEVLWISDIYPFMLAGFLVIMGTLGDRFGRKRLLLLGAALFGVGSVVAAFADGPVTFIVARAALGMAGAMMLPNSLALVARMFAVPRQRALAIGLWVSCFMIGTAVGPVVGGLLLSAFWWGSAMLIGAPAMLALLLVGPSTIPEVREGAAGPVDVVSFVLSVPMILLLVQGLKEVARNGITASSVAFTVAGVALCAVFARRQLRLASPLLDVRLFRHATFTVGVLFMLFGSAVMSGTLLVVSQYLQQVLGFSPMVAGLWSVPSASGLVLTSLAAPFVARRFPAGYVMAAGLVLTVTGFVVLTRVDAGGDLTTLVVGLVLVQTGIGFSAPLGTDLVVGTAPPQEAGSASALAQTGLELGGAVGIAGLGTAALVTYRAAMAHSPVAAARDTLSGALDSAHGLAPAAATELVTQARAAFTTALHVAATIGAGISVLLVAGAVLLARSSAAAEQVPAVSERVPG